MIGATGWLTAGQADKNHATSQRVTQHQQLFKTRNQKYLIRLLLTFLTISTFVHHAQAEKYVGKKLDPKWHHHRGVLLLKIVSFISYHVLIYSKCPVLKLICQSFPLPLTGCLLNEDVCDDSETCFDGRCHVVLIFDDNMLDQFPHWMQTMLSDDASRARRRPFSASPLSQKRKRHFLKTRCLGFMTMDLFGQTTTHNASCKRRLPQ